MFDIRTVLLFVSSVSCARAQDTVGGVAIWEIALASGAGAVAVALFAYAAYTLYQAKAYPHLTCVCVASVCGVPSRRWRGVGAFKPSIRAGRSLLDLFRRT